MIAAPVGPIGLLCIRQTFEKGMLVGITIGLGAAIADTFFGIIALGGMKVIWSFFKDYEQFFHLFGGLFLFIIACKIFYHSPRLKEIIPTNRGLIKNGVLGFTVTLTNPVTIMTCFALFTGIGVSFLDNRTQFVSLIVGIFCGSVLCWVIVSVMASVMRQRFSTILLHQINHVVGIILIIVSLGVIFSAIGRDMILSYL